LRKVVFPLLVLILVLSGCDLSSPEEASIGEIENAFATMELAYDLHHIEDFMVFYDEDFLHNGDDIDNARLDWEIRFNDYQGMELSEINIELDGDRATVSLVRKFINNGAVQIEYNEPEDNGDMSYWQLRGNDWLIMGNEASGK
jgi:hypothetical protein